MTRWRWCRFRHGYGRWTLEIAPILSQLDVQYFAELGRAASDIRSMLCISPHLWAQVWITLGDDGAITILAAIYAPQAAGQVKSPGGLFRRMMERHQASTLRLDRTLFGLAEKINKVGACL